MKRACLFVGLSLTGCAPQVERFEIRDAAAGYRKTAIADLASYGSRIDRATVNYGIRGQTKSVPLSVAALKSRDGRYAGSAALVGSEFYGLGRDVSADLNVDYAVPLFASPASVAARTSTASAPRARIQVGRIPSCMRTGDKVSLPVRLAPVPEFDRVSLRAILLGNSGCLNSTSSHGRLTVGAGCPASGPVKVAAHNRPLIPGQNAGQTTIKPSLLPPFSVNTVVGNYVDVTNPTEGGPPPVGAKTRSLKVDWVVRSDAKEVILEISRVADNAIVEGVLLPASTTTYSTALEAGAFVVRLRASFDGCFQPFDWSGNATKRIEVPS